MAKLTKKSKEILKLVDKTQVSAAVDAFALLAKLPQAKFVESIDVAINLGVDPRKSDQVVRGAAVLPHGTGKTVRVAVFAQGANAKAAQEAGADVVGFEDLSDSIKAGNLDFDVVIASPDAMRIVGQLGQILGPKGLMPNPKVGTVTNDVATAVTNAKSGQVRFRTDKSGIIHASIGKINFDHEKLKENLKTLLVEVNRLKPSTSKGVYVRKVSVSSTMGPSITVDISSI